MVLFNQLQENKGTTSSALGKELAERYLGGDGEILPEAVQLVIYDRNSTKSKNIRAGAAKIIEKIAEKQPESVAPYLGDLFPALEVEEPQTRWMIIMVFGYCAHLNPESAKLGINYAKGFIKERQGVCLSGAAEIYLGYIGSVSNELADMIFPILLDAYDDPLPNEMDWILEAFIKILDKVSSKHRELLLQCATEQLDAYKPSTKKRAGKILKMCKSG